MNSFSDKERSTNESTHLNGSDKEYYAPQSLWSQFKLQMKNPRQRSLDSEYRIVKPGKPAYPRVLFGASNKVDNTKYKWYNFMLLFLYFEFSQFSNLNYLLLCVSQFFPALKVGGFIRLLDIVSYTAVGDITAASAGRDSSTLQNQEAGP